LKLLCLFVAAALLPAQVPTLVETTLPVYSDEATRAELEGIVFVSAMVGADGYAHDLRVSRPLGLGLDEKALEAVRMWRLDPAILKGVVTSVPASIPVPFVLSTKNSRWHLLRVTFETPAGADRAAFLTTSYPPGAGISDEAVEQATLVNAMGRHAMATISFDIDRAGVPANFVVEESSEKAWGKEAVGVLQSWRFTPAKKNGTPVDSRGTVLLAWGRRALDAMTLGQLTQVTKSPVASNSALVGQYSEEAARAGIEGIVEVSFLLDDEGKPRNARVVRGLGHGLDEKALEAVSKISLLRFNGVSPKADGVMRTVGVQFRLPEAAVKLRR
jgi:TonB family protein